MSLFGLFGPPNIVKLIAEKDIFGLVKALSYKNEWTTRAHAAQALGEMGSLQAVESLVIALKDEQRSVREKAAEALGRIGDRQAVEPLIAALQDVAVDVKLSAVVALGKIGDMQAVEPLAAVLKDDEYFVKTFVRKYAAEALGKLGDVRAVESLVAALKDNDVQMKALSALGQIGDAQAVQPIVAILEESENVESKTKTNNTWVEAKDKWMKNSQPSGVKLVPSDEYFKMQAITLKPSDEWLKKQEEIKDERIDKTRIGLGLGPIKEERIREQETIKENRIARRRAAVVALGQIRDAQAVEPLVNALKDNDHLLRSAAAVSLGQIGDARAVIPLIETLRNKDSDTRQAAVQSLIQIGDASVDSLATALEDENPLVRSVAANALGTIGGKRIVELLIAALEDKDNKVKQKAEPLVGIENRIGKRRVAAAALGQIRDRRAVQPLISALKDEDRLLRSAAAVSLGKIGDLSAVEPLVSALQDQDGNVKEAAAEALSSMGREVLPPKWPRFSTVLYGLNPVRVKNTNEFAVRVGLRCGNQGFDFVIPPGGVGMHTVPDGSYDIYFQYSTELLTLYQGDHFSLSGNGIEIRIQEVIGGNYNIRKAG